MSDSVLKIGILGPFRAVVAGVERRIASHKQRQLLAELAMGRGRPMSRDDLFLALWPDSDEQHARDSLRHALWQLRRELGPAAGMLLAQGGRLALDQQVAIDVVAFEQSASGQRPDDLQAALDVYRGDLCRELTSEQAEIERERLRRLFVAAGDRLAASELEAGDSASAAETARRVLRHDPYREEIHRHMLRALASTGDLAGLVAHFRRLSRMLHAELGVEPGAETQALYADLMRGAASLSVATVRKPGAEPPPSLVGRQVEYRQLVEALIDSVDQRGRVVHLSGEAGSGKTRLLDELVRVAAEHGFQVVSGRAVGVEGQLGYQVWVDALRPFTATAADLPPPWPGVLADLLPDLAGLGAVEPGQVAPQIERMRLFEGVARLLARLADRVPTLIVLDDLHWADADALHLLHYLARNVRTARITIVSAARPIASGANQPLSNVLHSLRSTESQLDVSLGPLDLAGVTALLERASLTAHTASLLGPRITNWTNGNPFFVFEATRALIEQGLLRQGQHGSLEWAGAPLDDGRPLTAQLPRGVRETILSRVDIQREETWLVLNVASAIGQAVALDLLRNVSGLDESEVLNLLEPALAAGLLSDAVVDGSPALTFSHELVREAIYQQQPAIVRAAVHRRIAAALEAQSAPSAS